MTERNPSHEDRIRKLEAAGGGGQAGSTTWLGRNWQFCVNFALVVIVGLFTVFQPQWKQEDANKLKGAIDSEVDTKLRENHFGEIAGEVKTMGGKLDEISGFLKIVVAKEMQNNSKLSPIDFEKHLPQVASTLAVANIVHAETAPVILTDLQARLLATNQSDAPFWLASSSFVSLRSFMPSDQSNGECLSTYTNTMIATAGTTTSFNGIPLYQNCTLNLDISTPKINTPDSNKHLTGPDIACKHCRVIYSGGPIPSFKEGLRSIRFVDCSFEISTHGVPPNDGKAFLITLLKSADQNLIDYKATKT